MDLFWLLNEWEAYKLQLPAECRIHPVVHVSQLKRHVPPSIGMEDDILQIPVDPDREVTPIQFIDSHMCRKGASSVAQILVQWSDTTVSLPTWEESEDLHCHFSNYQACGQASFHEEGYVRTRPAKSGKSRRKSNDFSTTENECVLSG